MRITNVSIAARIAAFIVVMIVAQKTLGGTISEKVRLEQASFATYALAVAALPVDAVRSASYSLH